MRLRQSEVASASRAAALASLRAQVHPHFLFNSLNTLRHLIDEDPKLARDTVTQLSKILRYSLRHGETSLVPLRDEWEAVEAYLQIESARFEQRLRLSTDIEPASLDYSVPPLLLQTLVENAVKFGVSPSENGADIRIESRLQGSNLIVTVSNSGKLAADATIMGLGLSNARQRISLLFGDEASLDLREHEGHVIATVLLPTTS
jgi:LytS/YehU family sensor histidine kinase